jgi:hypothetical protein
MSTRLIGPHAATAAELKARLELEREARPFLLLRDGDEVQQLLPLPDDRSTMTIGRSADCDVPLQWDGQVSRVHAELERIGDGWAIVDGGLSRNGSFVNGERLRERRRLADGDVVSLGSTPIVYRQPVRQDLRVATETVAAKDAPAPASVSPAQMAVLKALCRPFADGDAFAAPATNNQIAEELFLSLDAVKGHLRVLFVKFGLEDLPQNEKRLRLAERSLRSGLVRAGDL